jgi:hypothetical protein
MNAISIVISSLALVVSVVGVYVSYLVAKKYGDFAGTKAARGFQQHDAAKARITALQSLLNEVTRIRKMARRNAGLVRQVGPPTMVRMPVAAFEAAFVSGSRCLSEGSELLDAVTDYLTEADTINLLIDSYFWLAPATGTSQSASSGRGEALSRVREISERVPEILDRLDGCLKSELEMAQDLLFGND